MKKALLFLTTIIISASAMEKSKHKAQPKSQSITDLIFRKLASSPSNFWSGSLDPSFYSVPKSALTARKNISPWDDESLFDMINPDKLLKYTLIFSGQRPRSQQQCSVFIKKKGRTFFSKIFFDDNGNLDHIDTQITLQGQKKVKKFEQSFVIDDQTECEETITNKDQVTWSFTTKEMPFDEFVKKFHD